MAFIQNMYSDNKCRNSVTTIQHMNTKLKSGTYYGWVESNNANCCVKAGVYDEMKNSFCLVYPFEITGETMKLRNLVKECCIPHNITNMKELTDKIQKFDTINCIEKS